MLGKYIVYQTRDHLLSSRIVEVEAYVGEEDPACHAAPGPTPRNRIMYGPAGFAYIYLIYGMYHCLNFVTQPKGSPAAVLLRAAEPHEGIDLMLSRAPHRRERTLLSGPGRFCQAFGLTLAQNGLDLTGSVLFLEDRGQTVENVVRTPRIGIRRGREHLWRFFDGDSEAVSARRTREKIVHVRT